MARHPAWSLFTLALLVACGDRPLSPGDGGVSDSVPGDVFLYPPSELTCAGDCSDYVVSSITFPQTPTPEIGVDENGDGVIDNVGGQILAALIHLYPSSSAWDATDHSIHAGENIHLLRIKAPSLINAAPNQAAAQMWLGEPQACCQDPDDGDRCEKEARAGCLGGAHAFKPASTKGALFGGRIDGGRATFGPTPRMPVRIDLPEQVALQCNLTHARILGTLKGERIERGVIAGVITPDEIAKSLNPALALMLDRLLHDSSVSSIDRHDISILFDVNQDGGVDVHEVANNNLLNTFLAGDVDVDGDGVRELSMALHFEAVGARITP